MNLDDTIKNHIKEEIEIYDDIFYQNNKRSSRLWYKGFIKRKLIIKGYRIDVKIRYYLDLITKTYVYPVYSILNLKKGENFCNETRKTIAKRVIVDNMSYKNAGCFSDEVRASVFTVRSCVLEFADEFKYDVNKQNLDWKYDRNQPLFISIDDTFLNLKNNNQAEKYRFRMVNFYQFNSDYKICNLAKNCLIFKCKQHINTIKPTIELINDFLEKYWYIPGQNHANIYVCGDGAEYINRIAMTLNFEQILDKFHCLRNILRVFNYQSLKRDLVEPYAIQFNQYKKEIYFRIYQNLIEKDFQKVYEILQYSVHIFNDEPKKKSVMRLKNYIKKHQKHIENWGLFPFNPTMTETFIKSVIKYRFGSVGRVFSYDVFVKLLALNCLVFEWI